jgi:two-component system, NtrC family, C4-dicarboxylate transport sensor histidine kinase DctB
MHEWSSVVADTPRICLVPKMTDLRSLLNIKGSSEVSSVAPGSARWLVRGASALALIVAASWLGYAVAFYRGQDHLRAAAQQRLAVEAARLDGYLSRFEYLPSLLETSPNVFRLLGAPGDPALQQSVSLYLKSINLLAGADNLYVLGVSGDALAAADFGTSRAHRLVKICRIARM